MDNKAFQIFTGQLSNRHSYNKIHIKIHVQRNLICLFLPNRPLSDHCTASKIEEICKSRVPVDFYSKVLCVLELIMLKKNIVYVPYVLLTRNDINVFISAICSNRL